jgi:replicative DNA helicase
VLFISQEMSAEQLAERMVADLCQAQGVTHAAIRDRTLTNEQKREVCRAYERIKDLPLQIIDRPSLTLAQVRRLVLRWKRRFAARGVTLELVIIDYLQLMGGDASNGRYELVSEISRGLKGIAKSEELCVFALSQLSRGVENRPDKRPLLSDLRESGQIEQDADAVIFFLRLEYYHRQAEPLPDDPKRAQWERDLGDCRDAIEFICAKRRNGSSGARFGQFLAESQAVRG